MQTLPRTRQPLLDVGRLAGLTIKDLTLGSERLAGLMWLPFSWIIRHWIGAFHSHARALLIVAAWYAFPAQRFVFIPAIIVAIYIVTIVVLERRWRRVNGDAARSRLAASALA